MTARLDPKTFAPPDEDDEEDDPDNPYPYSANDAEPNARLEREEWEMWRYGAPR